jgi:hypothetical protein
LTDTTYILKNEKEQVTDSIKNATKQWLKESFINFALRSQKIYAEYNVKKELWQQLSWMMDIAPHCGTYFLEDLYKLTEDVTKCEVNHLFCTGYGSLQSNECRESLSPIWSKVYSYRSSFTPLEKHLDFKNNKGVKNLWLGACWAEGLRANTMNAIENGFKGLFCAPLHSYRKFNRMESWQFDNFEWSIEQWRKYI